MDNLGSLNAGAVVLLVFRDRAVVAVVGLILANIVVSIGVSLWTKTFYLAKTGEWLFTRVIPYLLGWGTVKLIALTVLDSYRGATETAIAFASITTMAALAGHVLDALRVIFPDIPAFLGDAPKIPAQSGT